VSGALAGRIAGALGAAGVLAAAPIPTPIGVTPAYELPAHGQAAAAGRPVGSLACSTSAPVRFRAHLELFARKLVLLVPAGIGIAPPLARDGAYARGGRCSYPLRTREPTGVVEVGRAGLSVGDLFRVWGQPLSPTRLAGFRGRVVAFVNGRRVAGDPRAIPLRKHDEIVLEIGGFVPPHASYLFPAR